MKNLLAKIYKIQLELKPVIKSENNPFFKSKYFDINGVLGELRPLWNKHGIVVMQPLASRDGRSGLVTRVCDPDSGEGLEEFLPLPELADPQKFGAAVSYFRRFALVSLFCIEADDDKDGENIVRPAVKSNTMSPEQLHRNQLLGTKLNNTPPNSIVV